MRQIVLLALLSGTCFASAQPSDDAVKKEIKLFQGKWQAVSAFEDGKPLGDDLVKKMTLVVDGNKFTFNSGDSPFKGTFTVDPTKKIKTIDAFMDDSKIPLRGIYEIKGDTRKSCFSMDDKIRPDGFRKEKGYIILEWKFVK